MSDTEEADRFEDYPHPREQENLIGHADAERAFLDAYRGGRLHHAWIIGGPEGIGKATLAYRIARFLFAHPDPASPAVKAARDLAVEPANPAFRKVQSLGHPDLAVLRRTEKDGKMRTEIAVEQVRRAIELFENTAGEGGWRICVIDPADELNKNSANALLKTIEEPPPRSLFLIVAHAPGRLLPTIRSRGRLITLAPLSEEDLTRVVGGLVDEEPDAIAAAVKRAEGSVRRALSLLDPDLAGIGDRTRALLDGLPALPSRALLDLAGKTFGRAGEAVYEEVIGAVRAWMSDLLRRHAGEGARRLQPLSELWEKMQEDARIFDTYNIDKRPFIVGLFSDMADAVARLRPVRTS